MGTNYYLKTSLGEGQHIGKTHNTGTGHYAWTWAIAPAKIRQLRADDVIVDEYGKEYDPADLLVLINNASERDHSLIGEEFS